MVIFDYIGRSFRVQWSEKCYWWWGGVSGQPCWHGRACPSDSSCACLLVWSKQFLHIYLVIYCKPSCFAYFFSTWNKKKSFVIEAQREIILNMTFYQPRSRRYKFVLWFKAICRQMHGYLEETPGCCLECIFSWRRCFLLGLKLKNNCIFFLISMTSIVIQK